MRLVCRTIALAVLLVLSALLSWVRSAETAPTAAPAMISVRLPADAQVELQGVKMTATGDWRRFASPPLAPGIEYTYTLKATWDEAGQPRTVERQFAIRAGAEIEIDLRPDGLNDEERQVLEWTNAERRRHGLAPLVPHPRLTAAARNHSQNMARLNVLAHVLGGRSPFDRMRAAGYDGGAAGENCAQGPTTAREVVAMWMRSAGHRANILNPRFREIGIGIGTSRSGERFYTQTFGTR